MSSAEVAKKVSKICCFFAPQIIYNFDTTDEEYSIAPNDGLIIFWR